MTILLTPQQLQALDSLGDGLPVVVDPRSNHEYVLLSRAEYEAVREIVEDERRQRVVRAVALRNAAGRMEESP